MTIEEMKRAICNGETKAADMNQKMDNIMTRLETEMTRSKYLLDETAIIEIYGH